jgi:hypothetical protein
MRGTSVIAVLVAVGAALAALALSARPTGAWIIALVVLALGAGISLGAAAMSAKARRQKFAARPDLGLEGVYREYYAHEGIHQPTFARVWAECAETLGVPAGKLRPTDRFDRELKGLDRLQVTGDAVGYIFDDAAAAAERAGLPFDGATLATLDDLVRQLVQIKGRDRG